MVAVPCGDDDLGRPGRPDAAMREGSAFHGTPRGEGARDRLVASAVVVLAVGFVAIALAKPWAGPPAPEPSTVAIGSPDASPRASLPSALLAPAAVAPPAPRATPLPVAFTMPTPPPAPAAWSGLRWRRLAPDDPLRLVTAQVRWTGGFVAVGSFAGLPASPLWTSADGRDWRPLEVSQSTAIWPGLAVLGLEQLASGLVALTEAATPCGGPCAPGSAPPVMPWTSSDGRRWVPGGLPAGWLEAAAGSAPIAVVGPAGLLVASTGRDAHLALSPDGAAWRALPAAALPSRFALQDLVATATGYVAVGLWPIGNGRQAAASLRSADGIRWSPTPTILPPSDTGVRPTSIRLVAGPDGLIAVGQEAARPRRTLWWQSSDGRQWTELRGFGPLGATPCAGEGCGPGPNGTLVGDGRRFVALRGGSGAAAWTSIDGRTWRRLATSGDVPDGYAARATLLPGGVLVGDGTTSWFGEAVAP